MGQNHKNLPELIKVAEKRGIKYPINLVLCAVHVSRDLKCLEKLRTNEPKKSPPLRVRIKEYGTCYKKKWTVMLAAAIFLWVLACAARQNICELKKKNLVKDQTLSKQDEYSDFTYWTFSINQYKHTRYSGRNMYNKSKVLKIFKALKTTYYNFLVA